MTITRELVEFLIHASEGEALDFKRDQYPLSDEKQKGELVKDVLSFANGWRTSDAYILIGVEEVSGGPARLVGLDNAPHLADANVQQLVNAKTNAPIRFECAAVTIDGFRLDAIRVPHGQRRPFFLKKDFGDLRANVVYIRRGSSTAIALPDEIASMGSLAPVNSLRPELKLCAGNRKERAIWGESPAVLRTQLLPERLHYTQTVGELQRAMRFGAEPSPEDMHRYRRARAKLAKVDFVVRNSGDATAHDARALLRFARGDWKIVDADNLPTRPRGRFATPFLAAISVPRKLSVRELPEFWEVDARFGKVQPKADAWCSDGLWLDAESSVLITAEARIFDDSLSEPSEQRMEFRVDVEAVDEVRTPHPDDADEEGNL